VSKILNVSIISIRKLESCLISSSSSSSNTINDIVSNTISNISIAFIKTLGPSNGDISKLLVIVIVILVLVIGILGTRGGGRTGG